MVNVETKGLFDGQFTKLWKQIYMQFSSKPLNTKIKVADGLSEYFTLLGEALKEDFELLESIKLRNYKDKDFDEEKVIVGFSGGKDSLACVLKLMDDGYKPILFYVDGINRSYTSELDHAKSIAESLGLELYAYKLKVTGKCDFIENPTKNQFILALMVDYGVKLNINKYAFGTVYTDELKTISTEYMLSDCYELLMATEHFYQKYIPYFELLIPLEDETESFCVIDKFNKTHLLDECFSCMTPLRYKKNIVNTNIKKYGVSLLPNRCGSCYKCCQEALILSELGVVKYDSSFLSHCNDIVNKMQDKFDATANAIDEKPWINMDVIKRYKKGRK